MSNIYRSQFGLKNYQSLDDIIKQGPSAFEKNIRLLDNQKYNYDSGFCFEDSYIEAYKNPKYNKNPIFKISEYKPKLKRKFMKKN